jgi:hypothetical protein
MTRMTARIVLLVLMSLALRAAAQVAAPAPAPPTRAEPAIKRTVIEDDQVKIEELRVRGQVQRITISPKASGVRAYEIAPPDSGRDPSQQSKGISGHSLWQLFSF